MAKLQIPKDPVVSPPLTLFQRLSFGIKIRLFQFLVKQYLRVKRLPFLINKSIQPSYVKSYPVHPRLKNRIFVPDSYSPGDPPLPLYIDIHGGGFCICEPEMDDPFCSSFSKRNKVLVVSLDYPKAPGSPFPGAVHALTDLVKAVLQDDTLPFDKNKVVIGGFSAGANLSLAVCQDKSLQNKIGGIVAFYPATNFVTKIADNLATRPANAPPDALEHMGPLFNAAYLSEGQDRRDPLLSVCFAPREILPPKIFVFGCELDMLCRDAEIMAEHWAGEGEKKGTDLAWEKNGIKWEKIMGFEHGYDQNPKSGEQQIKNNKRAREMYDAAAEWLFREVYVS